MCYYNILENKILAPAGIPFSKIPHIIFSPCDTGQVSWENNGKKKSSIFMLWVG